MNAYRFFLGLLISSAIAAGAAGETITTGSLVREMTDLARLGDFPDPAYETVQFSSHDRRSGHPGGPEWHANSDGFGGEPVPNFEGVVREPGEDGVGVYLVCDAEGPGAVARVWTARISGTIRMYLDGSAAPVFEGPAQQFFQRIHDPYVQAAGLDAALFENTFRQREACYFPIPFAKRCRVEWEGNLKDTHFYEIQMRLYEKGAEVKTFQPSDLDTYADDFRAAAEALANPDGAWEGKENEATPVSAILPAGETKDVMTLEGPAAIHRLELRARAADLNRALRQTVLHISFDGYPWGQVQAPLGDFFGAAPGINPYESTPFSVKPDGTMVCRYVMPFESSMTLRLENRGNQPVSVTGSIHAADYDWNPETSMHFRARWRVDHDLLNTAVYDLPFLLANGKGVYVGTASILMNPNRVPTSYGNWWGEGDEKIFVDENRLPTIFGTGSEDYYNYAWSSPDIFQYPYCGQPRNDGPDNRGFVTNHRWHILDPIPFENRLLFYMEFYSHERTPGYSYARIAYHYARPGLMDDHLPITNEDVRHLELEPWLPEARGAARDAVFHQTEELLSSHSGVSMETGGLYAGGKVWVWEPQAVGDEIVLPLPVAEKGKYRIWATAELSGDGGRFTALLNGSNIGMGDEEGRVSLHMPHRTVLRNFGSGERELDRGGHRLTLRHDGPGAGGGNRIAIDFIWVQKR